MPENNTRLSIAVLRNNVCIIEVPHCAVCLSPSTHVYSLATQVYLVNTGMAALYGSVVAWIPSLHKEQNRHLSERPFSNVQASGMCINKLPAVCLPSLMYRRHITALSVVPTVVP